MFKASELVAFCLSMIGMPYWYGTCVYNCTTSLRSRKAKQYPSHYTSSRTSRYNSDISKKLVCMDCVGMIKGFFWTNGGVGVKEAIGTGKAISSKYGGNGCPDRSANGMLSWCKAKGAKHGKIADLPDVPGVLLFSPGHVGVYIGGGYAVEARGFKYGVVKTKVASRSWVNWAYMPSSVLQYDTEDGANIEAGQPSEKPSAAYKLGDRIIKKGMKGDDVKELQAALVKLGYDLGTDGAGKNGVDGDCGSKTVAAIREFQQKYDLEVDGEYGPKSHARMIEVLSKTEPSVFQIVVTGGTVNVRNEPNTATGKIMYLVKKNNVLDAIGIDEATGWYRLSDENYISNKYASKA